MSRILTLEIPENLYRALAGMAARDGLSPEAVATTWLIDAIARRANQAVTPPDKLGIVWEGPFLDLHSFSQVNRELCLRLIARGHELALIPSKPLDAAAHPFSGHQILEGHFHRALRGPIAAHVRHEWPPSFTPPPEGHWVIIQPWEFGSIPRPWVDPMSTLVDEVWAYSRFVQESLRRRRRSRGEGARRTPGNRSPPVPPRSQALPTQDRQTIPISLRRRDDPPQGHRHPFKGVHGNLHCERPGLLGDQRHGRRVVLSRSDGAGTDRRAPRRRPRGGNRVSRSRAQRRRTGRALHGVPLPRAAIPWRRLLSAHR